VSILVATYNVLADSYVNPAWYPSVRRDLLAPARRAQAVADHVLALDADVVCLQEVETPMFAAITARMAPAGYHSELVKKEQGRPDGCAFYARRSTIDVRRTRGLAYADARGGNRASGHVAQIAEVAIDGQTVAIANTHLKWDAPAAGSDDRIGYRQMVELLEQRARVTPAPRAWIVCGDFNSSRASDVVSALAAAGFRSTHAHLVDAATCYANRRAEMVDYIFHDSGVTAEPLPIAEVRDDTPLPRVDQPSDHVPVLARFTLVP
jgi:mRNA deadenylase 3'-5' endonuclease subunit Ccr4